MSGGWFNVDMDSLQSSIFDSVNEASKIMEELNLDNMQNGSGIGTRKSTFAATQATSDGDDDVITNLSHFTKETAPLDLFYQHDLEAHGRDSDGSEWNDSNDQENNVVTKAGVNGAKTTATTTEDEDVIEFTEFGVPIRINKQAKSGATGPREQSSASKVIKKEKEGVESQSFSMWSLDSMQEQQKAVSHAEEEGGGGVAEQCVEEREGGGRGAAPSKIITPNDLLLRTHGGTRATAKSSLPLYVDQSLMSDYLYPVAKLFSESPPSDVDEEEGGVGRHVHAAGHTSANLEVILNNDVDDEEVHLSDHEDDSSPQSAAATAPESTSFFGTAASTLLLLNTKANIPNNLFSRPSFFDNDSGDDEDDTEDPIYLRVEQNKVNPPAPRSSQQSLFQSGSAFFASATPTASSSVELTRAEVRRQSRAYGVISKAITCVMWLVRLMWNVVSACCAMVMSLLRSMFDCPAPTTTSSSAAAAHNFCETLQHPVTRARLVAEYRAYLFGVIVSNNFIAVMTTLLLAASYWKFRRYGTDSGD